MDPRVQEFLDRTRQEIEARNRESEATKAETARKEREETLIRAGLYDEKTEYLDQTLPQGERSGTYIYRDGKYVCEKVTRTPLDVTDEEYAQIVAAIAEREKWADTSEKTKKVEPAERETEGITLEVDSKAYLETSSGARFLRGIAWTIWIGGAIAAVASSIIKAPGSYNGSTEFSWTTFLTSLLTYIYEGGFVMCFAEALDNIQAIRDMVQGFKGFKKKKQKKA